MKQKLTELQKLMNEGGLEQSAQLTEQMLKGMNRSNICYSDQNKNDNAAIDRCKQRNANDMLPRGTESEETIYRNAVKRVGEVSNSSQRYSSSSEEEHNISDEIIEMEKLFKNFSGGGVSQPMENKEQDEPQPGTSYGSQLGDRQ